MNRAVVLVRNAVTNDARVLRQARALQADGYDVVVVGVQTTSERRASSVEQGVAVRRIAPRSPAALMRAVLRRSPAGAPVSVPVSATTSPGAPAAEGGRTRLMVGRVNRWATTLDFHRRALAEVRRERPRLVVANDYNTLWSGLVGARSIGATLVYDSHELWADRNGRNEVRTWLVGCEAVLVRLADVVLTASPGYADALAARYRVPRPTVVRNIPDAQPPRVTSPDQGPPRLVYVGGLLRGRGIEELIAAVARVPDAVLELYGPSAPGFDAVLRDAVVRHGVTHRVRFCGVVPPQDVPAAAAGAHLGLSLIQPVCRSYELTLPNKLFEYVAAGVPVLVSDLPVMRDLVVGEGIGVVAPPDDVEAIARAIVDALAPERQRALRACVADFATRATWAAEQQILLQAVRGGLRS